MYNVYRSVGISVHCTSYIVMLCILFWLYVRILTSQWLNISCGYARPDVCFRISCAKLYDSITGKTALTMNVPLPSIKSADRILPWRRPKTAYILPMWENNMQIKWKYQRMEEKKNGIDALLLLLSEEEKKIPNLKAKEKNYLVFFRSGNWFPN